MSEPKVLVFICNGCSYGGADQAGGVKLEYPPGVRMAKVMCSGRVDPQMVLDAFSFGMDGVLILGCHPGDCHYREGNYSALKRAKLLAPMLEQYGIHPDRFRIDWVRAGEGERFSRLVTEMVEAVVTLEPPEIEKPFEAHP